MLPITTYIGKLSKGIRPQHQRAYILILGIHWQRIFLHLSMTGAPHAASTPRRPPCSIRQTGRGTGREIPFLRRHAGWLAPHAPTTIPAALAVTRNPRLSISPPHQPTRKRVPADTSAQSGTRQRQLAQPCMQTTSIPSCSMLLSSPGVFPGPKLSGLHHPWGVRWRACNPV